MPVNVVPFHPNTQYIASVYADANLLCYSRDRHSVKYQDAILILGNLVIQNVEIYISNLVLDEMMFAFLRRWYQRSTGARWDVQRARQNRPLIRRFSTMMTGTVSRALRIPNIQLLDRRQNPRDIKNEALNIFDSEGLLPRDCYHLAYATRNQVYGFVTSDSDFDTLNLPNHNLTVYKY